jgi:DNA-directed RNA polymerase III subunit RPC1
MRKTNDSLQKAAIFKKVIDRCKKSKHCPYCHVANGTVKKITGIPMLQIIHAKYKMKHMEDELDALLEQLQNAMKRNRDVVSSLSNAVEDLLPTRALDLLKNVSDEDCEVMWIDPLIGRPENLILQNILVPPVPIRPSVAMDSGEVAMRMI